MYHEIRGHRITVVFDGWQSGSIKEETESRGGIRIVFSKQGQKADAVVIRLARSVGNGCVVLTKPAPLMLEGLSQAMYAPDYVVPVDNNFHDLPDLGRNKDFYILVVKNVKNR